jgi:hypothetical protein
VPLRKLSALKPSLKLGPVLVDDAPEDKSFWRTGLLLATSAALGGIAVAIWHRRTLAQIRQQADATEE